MHLLCALRIGKMQTPTLAARQWHLLGHVHGQIKRLRCRAERSPGFQVCRHLVHDAGKLLWRRVPLQLLVDISHAVRRRLDFVDADGLPLAGVAAKVARHLALRPLGPLAEVR